MFAIHVISAQRISNMEEEPTPETYEDGPTHDPGAVEDGEPPCWFCDSCAPHATQENRGALETLNRMLHMNKRALKPPQLARFIQALWKRLIFDPATQAGELIEDMTIETVFFHITNHMHDEVIWANRVIEEYEKMKLDVISDTTNTVDGKKVVNYTAIKTAITLNNQIERLITKNKMMRMEDTGNESLVSNIHGMIVENAAAPQQDGPILYSTEEP